MGIREDVRAAVADFESEDPKRKGKAVLTSGDRTWEDQLDIILQPKRDKNYLNIKARFLKAFTLEKLPASRKALPADQLKWWKVEILKQAGRSPGFPHVGGKAQDVSVKALSTDEKKALIAILKKRGVSVLMEKITGSTSIYGVPIGSANVFHCHK